ncbi:hypothetical protein BU14_1243s0001 [Porphyra umbilicalis]|uniref:Uncharacterized protein n=1 Tax=Porphyra umbilicalis TaxID=2786 RepID=A0A1X6NMZ1_PORUM|nr:hypothetical protein BU14_1243s0001 [Porphyra umbilicalis]|eukprot:OSX69723.1 hypothetical protein BU14_1243s0001 [Porphyra umbilicalis]
MERGRGRPRGGKEHDENTSVDQEKENKRHKTDRRQARGLGR